MGQEGGRRPFFRAPGRGDIEYLARCVLAHTSATGDWRVRERDGQRRQWRAKIGLIPSREQARRGQKVSVRKRRECKIPPREKRKCSLKGFFSLAAERFWNCQLPKPSPEEEIAVFVRRKRRFGGSFSFPSRLFRSLDCIRPSSGFSAAREAKLSSFLPGQLCARGCVRVCVCARAWVCACVCVRACA